MKGTEVWNSFPQNHQTTYAKYHTSLLPFLLFSFLLHCNLHNESILVTTVPQFTHMSQGHINPQLSTELLPNTGKRKR